MMSTLLQDVKYEAQKPAGNSTLGRLDGALHSQRGVRAYISRLDIRFRLKMGRMGFLGHFNTRNEVLYYLYITKFMRATKSRYEEKVFQIRTTSNIYTAGQNRLVSSSFSR
jgi:hypothetical protein